MQILPRIFTTQEKLGCIVEGLFRLSIVMASGWCDKRGSDRSCETRHFFMEVAIYLTHVSGERRSFQTLFSP